MVEQLHCKAALHLCHGHCLVVGNAGGGVFIGSFAHNIQRFLGKVGYHRAVIFAGNEVGYLPVEQRNVFRKDIVYAACNKACRSALYNVKVGNDEDGSAHRSGLLLAVENCRADICREAVGGSERRDGDKGDAELVSRVAAEVHNGSGAVGYDDLGVIELFHHLFDDGVLGAQAVCLEHDLLIGGDMLALCELVDDRIVDNGAFLAGKADIGHVLLEIIYRAVFDDDLFRFKLMVSAADAFADVLFAIHDHGKTPQLQKF